MPFVFTCSKCGGELNFKSQHKGTTTKCWKCGTVNTLPDNAATEGAAVTPRQTSGGETNGVETRYAALRVISKGYRLLAYIIGIGGSCLIVIGGVAISRLTNSSVAFANYGVYNWLTVGVAFLALAAGCFTLVATSEAIKIFIDIEENTRMSAFALRNIELSLKK